MQTPDATLDFTVAHDEPNSCGAGALAALTVPLFNSHVRASDGGSYAGQLNAERAAVLARHARDIGVNAGRDRRLTYVRYRDQIPPQAEEVARMAGFVSPGQTGIAARSASAQQSLQVRLQTLQTASDFQSRAAGDRARHWGTIP